MINWLHCKIRSYIIFSKITYTWKRLNTIDLIAVHIETFNFPNNSKSQFTYSDPALLVQSSIHKRMLPVQITANLNDTPGVAQHSKALIICTYYGQLTSLASRSRPFGSCLCQSFGIENRGSHPSFFSTRDSTRYSLLYPRTDGIGRVWMSYKLVEWISDRFARSNWMRSVLILALLDRNLYILFTIRR